MKVSTRNSWVGRVFDYFGFNEKFHEYCDVGCDSDKSVVVSPVEARVVCVGDIGDEGEIVSKNGKRVFLGNCLGGRADEFVGGKYINFYLSPKNRHFWITPCDGKFVYTQKNEGRGLLPVCVGVENILGVEMFSSAVRKNASIGSIFEAKDFSVAMLAVGSLNVNRICVDYEENEKYKRGNCCGYFSLGSSMLLCFPNRFDILVDEGEEVKMGQGILKMKE